MRIVVLGVAAWVAFCGLVSLGIQIGVGVEDVLFVKADLGPDAKEEGPKWVVYGVVPDTLSCVCDLIVFALPLRSLWSLKLRNPGRKTRLMLTFTVGFL